MAQAFSGPLRIPSGGGRRGLAVPLVIGGALVAIYMAYQSCKIEVPTGFQAILIRKVGQDLPTGMEIAPAPKGGVYSKGVQPGVLTEGRYFYNPYFWDWLVEKQVEVKSGDLGVRISLVGNELPPGQVLAEEGQKGIRREVLGAGRYPFNRFAETIETIEPVTIPPGYRGVVTLLTGKEPKDPNVVLVGKGERGVQRETLPPGTYPVNPYEQRVSIVDCRSSRYATGQGDEEMSFLTSDGFEVRLDLAIEYRVVEERASEVFVLYNEDHNGDAIAEEIIAKIVTPETRSICRINGSKMSGAEFIGGETRTVFRESLMKSLTANCQQQGIEILPDGVSITQTYPPQQIADPMNKREVAKQNLALYQQQRDQQETEKQLKVETVMVQRKEMLVEAEREVNEKTINAQAQQTVAVTKAEQELSVAKTKLEAAKDQASALVAEAEAEAEGIRFDNKAQLAGLKTQVAAFDGDGSALAQNLLVGKLAPAYRSILSNSDGPLMEIFRQMSSNAGPRIVPPVGSAPAPITSAAREPGLVLPRDVFAPSANGPQAAEDHR